MNNCPFAPAYPQPQAGKNGPCLVVNVDGVGPSAKQVARTQLAESGGRSHEAPHSAKGSMRATSKPKKATGSAAGYLRTVFESGAALGPSAFEADAKARAKQEAEDRKRAEAEQRAQAKAEREALEQAKAAVKALTALERLMLAEEYRQGAGAGRSASWDAGKGVFKDQMERIQFNAWLQAKFKDSQ